MSRVFVPVMWVISMVVLMVASPAWVAAAYCTCGLLMVLASVLICASQSCEEDRALPGYVRHYFLVLVKVFVFWPAFVMMMGVFLLIMLQCKYRGP